MKCVIPFVIEHDADVEVDGCSARVELVAADVATQVALGTLLAPTRLARLMGQHAADPAALGVQELLDKLTATSIGGSDDPLRQRIAYRTIVTMAQVARRPSMTPEVALMLGQQVDTIARDLSRQKADGWTLALARQLLDAQQLERLLADRPRLTDVPAGDPIGESDWF